MARIRSVKPELRWSLRVASWPMEVRYFWVLLWGYVDDYGRGVDEPRLVKGDAFPLDDDVTAKTIDEWLDILNRSGVIHRYVVNGKRFLHVTHWSEHQKPQHPRASVIPECRADHAAENPHEPLMNTDVGPHEPLTPEQGAGRREGEQGDGRGSASASRRGNATTLPADWHPTPEHRTVADQHNLDLDAEAFRFRSHALAKDLKYVRWNSAFNQWLSNSASWQRPSTAITKSGSGPPLSTTDQRVATGLALTRKFEALDGGPQ